MDERHIGDAIVSSAMKIHSALGPGLLENAYELCLEYELVRHGFVVRRQHLLPLQYEDLRVDAAYRIDMLIDQKVVVEIKSVEAILPVHKAQLLSYLRLGGFRLGYLLNFNVASMKDGVKRVVNGL
jgi:GxxExxY protein